MITVLFNVMAIGATILIAIVTTYDAIRETRSILMGGMSFFSIITSYTMTLVFMDIMLPFYASAGLVSAINDGVQLSWGGGLRAIFPAILSTLRSDFLMINRSFLDFRYALYYGSIHLNEMHELAFNSRASRREESKEGNLPLLNIETLAHTAEEISEITASSIHLLTQSETAALANINDMQIRTLLLAYNNVKERLETNECPVSLCRPEKENTVVLVKQYHQEESWLSLPNGSIIIDRESLKGICINNPRHPTTRDSLESPRQYELNNVRHETRYRYHDYYVSEKETGISQELHMKGAVLRARLLAQPAAQTSEISTFMNNPSTLFATRNHVQPTSEESTTECAKYAINV